MDFYKNIENYCEGLLDESSRLAFEKAMSIDKDLSNEVDNYLDALKISEGLLEIDIMSTIEDLQKEETKKNISSKKDKVNAIKPIDKKTIFSIKQFMMAASVIGVLIFVGWWGIGGNETGFNEELWNNEYERPYDEDATKSSDLERKDLLSSGKYYFSLNEFENSEKALLDFISKTKSSDSLSKAYYWLGHNYMNVEKWDKAIKTFKKSQEKGVTMNIELCEKMKK